MEKKYTIYLIPTVSVIFATFDIIFLWRSEVITICGDGLCANIECTQGCKADCNLDTCKNANCDLALGENCENSIDCFCSDGFACEPQRPTVDEKGCHSITCGDDYCDFPETTVSCCEDCGCNEGYECLNNECRLQQRLEIEWKPRSQMTSYNLYGWYYRETYKRLGPITSVNISNPSSLPITSIKAYLTIGDVCSDLEVVDMLPSHSTQRLEFVPQCSKEILIKEYEVVFPMSLRITWINAEGEEHVETINRTLLVTAYPSI
jgi:hypothetical protein